MKHIGLIFFSLVFPNLIKANTTAVMIYSTGIYSKHTDTCVENVIFKSNYIKSLQYIEDYVEDRKTDKKKFGHCIDNMVRNSGIKSSVYYGYIFRYRHKTDFYNDKKKWLLWYKEAKCNNLHWK